MLKKDRDLIQFNRKKKIWLANDTSNTYVALAWVDVDRGLLPFLWELGFFPLMTDSHL
jgi:hypothetical protein